jgi:hypothetical protein
LCFQLDHLPYLRTLADSISSNWKPKTPYMD